jgi:hypothetical protein
MAETQDNNSKLDGSVPQDQVNKNFIFILLLKLFI